MSAGVPYIGSKISLVSNSEIRYEGVLYTINTTESTIALQYVSCFGTEGRKQPEIPPSSEVYDFIIFRGQDIKDLTVLESCSAVNDPAIVSINQKPAKTGKGAGASSGGGGYEREEKGGKGGKGAWGTTSSASGWGASGYGSSSTGAWAGWGNAAPYGAGYGSTYGGSGGAWGATSAIKGSSATKGTGKSSGKGDSKGKKGAESSGKGGKADSKGGKKGGDSKGSKGATSGKGGKDFGKSGKGGKDSGKGSGKDSGKGKGGDKGSGKRSGGGRSGGSHLNSGIPVGELQPEENAETKRECAEDFDVTAANEKFEKVKDAAEAEGFEDRLKPLPGYDKTKSFFDSISCEATERPAEAERPKIDREKAREFDKETFGDTRRPPRPAGGGRPGKGRRRGGNGKGSGVRQVLGPLGLL